MENAGGLISFSSVLRVLKERYPGSCCKVPIYPLVFCSEEEEAEHLLKMLSVEKALILKRSVHPLPNRNLYRSCLQMKAGEINLSKELHYLAHIQQALPASETSDGRPSNELDGLLSELNQLVLRRTSVELHLLPDCFDFLQILCSLEEALAHHLIDIAKNLYDIKVHWAKRFYGERLSAKSIEDRLNDMRRFNVAEEKAKGDRLRNEFLQRAELKPPAILRMIDCKATQEEGRVVLMDWKDCVQDLGYSALSHTFGQEVYNVFNCSCASIYKADSKPRCSFHTCPHDPTASNAANTRQRKNVQDILKMCGYLCEAGVHYAWHDGVCIAQHDEDEVTVTIQHMGWIYSNGKETIIFLHYVGEPRAPIWAADVIEEACRWHTRVWTLQEAALSKHRRYCIRVGNKPIREWHPSFAGIKKNVHLWYKNGSSSVKVVEEETFYENLNSLLKLVLGVCQSKPKLNLFDMALISIWDRGLFKLQGQLRSICFGFPTIEQALRQCTGRDSKHMGDRLNSILTLAGVKDFVAPKDTKLEASLLEFYKNQGQKGLARALFSINLSILGGRHGYPAHEPQRHKWLTMVHKLASYKYEDGLENGMRLTVLGNGRLEVRSPENGNDNSLLHCRKVRIVNKPKPLDSLVDHINDIVERKAVVDAIKLLITKAKGSSSVLEMNYGCNGRLYLPEVPSYCVGFLSTNLNFSEGHTMIRPSHLMNDGSDQRHRFMEDGESFDAYLVTIWGYYNKMLLLHGNDIDIMGGEVFKIGIFTPSGNFRSNFKDFMSTLNMKLEKFILI